MLYAEADDLRNQQQNETQDFEWVIPDTMDSPRRVFAGWLACAALAFLLLLQSFAEAVPMNDIRNAGLPDQKELRQVTSTSLTNTDSLIAMRKVFADPPADCRPMARWWWFGTAVEKEEIERELREMKRQGIGGVEVQPVYPLSLDDPALEIRNVSYLSDEWLELMRFAMEKARELGMVFDATFGSGWPFGGPHISLDLASKSLRCVQLEVNDSYTIRLTPPVELQQEEHVLRITALRVRPDGTLDAESRLSLDPSEQVWRSPGGRWRVMWFVAGHTFQGVKRATIGSEGLVHDHYDANAFAKHAAAVGDAYAAIAGKVGAGSIHAMFCDSLEIYSANWTDKLPEEFRKRRGYDLLDYLPALWNDIGPETPFVRWDYRRTLSEMALEQFFTPFARWCEKHGCVARVQAHGTPGDLIEAYGTADIPEGESYGHLLRFEPEAKVGSPAPSGVYPLRYAASSAAIFGKRLCSSESYTWLRMPRFMENLEDIKAESDIQFVEGVNNVVCHGYSYSPPRVGVPGWVFYASSLINHNNTWWPYFRNVADYVARACWLLRQGRTASDVCIYVPMNDSWAEAGQPPHGSGNVEVARLKRALFQKLSLAGYQYDVINDQSLISRARVSGRLLTAGEGAYKAIILASAKRIQPEAMARIAEFARSGGLVVFADQTPDSSCTLARREEETAEVRRLVAQALEDGALKVESGEIANALSPRIQSSIVIEPHDTDVGFRHRRIGDEDLYFIANVSPDAKRFIAEAQCGGRSMQMWDAMTGKVYSVDRAVRDRESISLEMRLQPFESVFLLLTEDKSVGLKPWPACASAAVREIPLDTGWKIRIPEDSAPINLDRLVSWTERPELLHYSGRGRYSIEFELPKGFTKLGDEIWLDLGDVKEVAEIKINGSPAGVAWKRPHELKVGRFLKPGAKRLEVIVTNLRINQVLGQPDRDFSDLNAKYGERVGPPGEKAHARPVPSGLLGPVRLVVRKME